MNEDDSETGDSVSVSMELTGEYDEVLSKLSTDAQEDHLAPLTDDLATIVATVDRIDGGTRSAVANNLPGEMTVDYDPEGVVTALQVLERYGLVTLEGNTWYPGTGVE